MKTILLVINNGFTARYLLRSDILSGLAKSGSRIVILSEAAHEKYFTQEFSGKNIVHELYRPTKYRRNDRTYKLFSQARLLSFKKDYFNNFTKYWKEKYFSERKNTSGARRVFDYALRVLIFFLDRSKFARDLFIKIESSVVDKVHRSIFEKYRPSLLITTSLGVMPYDRFIMQEAMDYKVKTMALILSWDNTTTKGISGAHADYVVAWTRTMRDELTKYHDIPSSNIYIGGVAQYDEYFKKSNLLSKDELVGQLNLSVDKKNIFFCLESPTSYKHNSDILRILAKNIMNKSIDCRCQLIARIHPIYFRIENESYRFESELRELNDIKTEFPFIVFDYPETLSKKMSFDMPITETYKLGALLQHSDVVLCFYSSMSIESCIFDTPVINIELFDRETIPNNILGNHAHNKRVLNTNGVRHASTERELVSAINNYIENPSLNSAERKMIVENETGPNKGCAAANIANHILSIL